MATKTFKKLLAFCAISPLLVCTIPAANAQPAPTTASWYEFNAPGPFNDIEIFTTWIEAPLSGLAYPAFQWSFENGARGYIGTQLAGTEKRVLFSIWDASPGSGTATLVDLAYAHPDICQRFTHEDSGVSCNIPYPWVEGREYKLRVSFDGTDATGENWRGTISDTVTGQTTIIGKIHVANTPGYQGYGRVARNNMVSFLEDFRQGMDRQCAGGPSAKVMFRGPVAQSSFYAADVAVAYYNFDVCNNFQNVTTDGRDITIHQIGLGTGQTTASYQSLWNTPEFQVKSISAPFTAKVGETIQVVASFYNGGPASSPLYPYGRLYLSQDRVITTSDTPLGDAFLLSLGGGMSSSVTKLVTLPNGSQISQRGRFYIGAIVDPTNAFTEVNKANNVQGVPIDITFR
ncbi:MAG: DUF3472 domain-containing protein [Pseudomonadota bacterium]